VALAGRGRGVDGVIIYFKKLEHVMSLFYNVLLQFCSSRNRFKYRQIDTM